MIYRVTGDHQENNENNGRLFSLASALPWLIPIPRHGAELQWGIGQDSASPSLAFHGQWSGTDPAARSSLSLGHSEHSEISPSLHCSRHTHTATLNYSRNKSTLPLHSNTEESFNHILQVLGHKEFFSCTELADQKWYSIIHRWGVRFVNVFMRGKTTEKPSNPIKWKLFFLYFSNETFHVQVTEHFEIQ